MAFLTPDAGVKFKDLYQGIERHSMAYKLLSSMGWREGDGLGAAKQGISTHIRAHKKFDQSGVGLKESEQRSMDWTLDMCKFSAVLKGLKEIKSCSAEEAAVCESLKFGGERKSKKKRSREQQSSPAESSEVENKNADSQPTRSACKHGVRYMKRQRNKMVKNYSSTDLAAILGVAEDQKFEPEMPREDKDVEIENIPPQEKKEKKKRKKSAAGNFGKASDAPSSSGEKCSAQETACPASDLREDEEAWWSAFFHRGSNVGASNSSTQQGSHPLMLSEADQIALYAKSQASKSQGHQGLGAKSAKSALSQWKGTRINFENFEDEDEGERNTEPRPANECFDLLPGGLMVVWPQGCRPQWFIDQSSKRAGNDTRNQDSTPSQNTLSEKQRKKCLKVARKMLKNQQSGVKLKEVVEKAIETLKLGDPADYAGYRSHVKRFLKNAEGWSVENGRLSQEIAAVA